MNARVGDLAIARFDPTIIEIQGGKRWCERVCLVTETSKCGPEGKRYHSFFYWEQGRRGCEIFSTVLPRHRLVRVRPKNNKWDGQVENLMIDDVVPC